MRTVWLAATTALVMTAATAEAQRVVAHGPGMRMAPMARPAPIARPAPMAHSAPMPQPAPMSHPATQGHWQGGHQGQHGGHWQGHVQGQWQGQHQWQGQQQWQRSVANSRSSVHVNVRNRWGGRIGNRWWGGARAPGGWGAYRRPFRGYVLPSYWLSPGFLINDWAGYGLAEPPYGYNWSRYYDDAVLVDGRGSVYDLQSGVDWDTGGYGDGGYAEGGDAGGYGDGGYSDDGYAGGPEGPGAPYGYPEDQGPPPPPHHAPPPPPAGRYAPPPLPTGPITVRPGQPVVVQSGGYAANGYYYPAPTLTTVTVTSTPVVTTTTEVFEDSVTYTRPAHKVWHRKMWRAKPRCTCS